MVALSLGSVAGIGDILSSVNNISFGDIASQLAMGAIATTLVAGAGTSSGQSALDPLHIFHKDGSQTVVSSKTISAAALNALSPAAQTALIQQGYNIVG
jgi:hypothetical protein